MRIGNGAYDQLQLDIYGELMDSIYLFNKYGLPIGYAGWKKITRIVDWVVENWRLKDEGIWEVRSGKQHFVYSKLMFEQMLGYSNHLGIYSEQIGIHGESLGNTPQAFTHLALISAAFNLDRTLG